MALAIIDDLGAIIIIALFYTNDLSMASLGVAAVAIAVLAVLNLCGVRRTGVYILVGVVLWTAVLKSGARLLLSSPHQSDGQSGCFLLHLPATL